MKNIYAFLPLSEKFVIEITERLARTSQSFDFDFMHFDCLLANHAEKHWNALLAVIHTVKFFICFTIWQVIFTRVSIPLFKACARLSSNFNNLTTKSSFKDRYHFSKLFAAIFLSFPSFSHTRVFKLENLESRFRSWLRVAMILIHFYFYTRFLPDAQ